MSGQASVSWKTGTELVDEIRATQVQLGTLAFWHLGQASWIVKSPTETVAFDPFLQPSSGQLQRTFEPPLHPSMLDFIDAVFAVTIIWITLIRLQSKGLRRHPRDPSSWYRSLQSPKPWVSSATTPE